MPYLVITAVMVQPDAIDGLPDLFDSTNRQLVATHESWLGATFSAIRDAGEIRVIARWHDPESYQRLRSSEEFAEVMSHFALFFLKPPEIAITEVLVEM